MKNIAKIALLMIVSIFTFISCSSKVPEFNEEEIIEYARNQVTEMRNGDYKSVADTFSFMVSIQVNEEKLKEIYEDTIDVLGEYIGEKSITTEVVDKNIVCTIIEEYENSGLKITLTYNDKNKVVGIFFEYESLDGDESNEVFDQVEFTVGEELKLDGILTLPKNVEKPPVVLLIQGSGQSDKNETIVLNTPFKDIAQGLAAEGIATLRYDKRYYTYLEEAQKLGDDLTLEDEVLEDVNYAIDALNKDERVGDIYILGHSLGGALAPAIAYENEAVKGIISMAGSLRPLYEISYDQNKASEKALLEKGLEKKDEKELEMLMMEVEEHIELLRGDISDIPNKEVLLGLPAGYQKSVKEYAGMNFIDKVNVPMLILQGEEDFQVYADVDYKLWEDTVGNRDNVTFKLYPKLNHLMMQTNGKKDVSEYDIKGTVEQIVIDDIASFILNQ